MITTAFIHQQLHYFYSCSELIDLQLGSKQNLTLSKALDILEQTHIIKRQRTLQLLSACLWLQSYILQDSTEKTIKIKKQNADHFIEMEGLKLCLLGLENFIQEIGEASVGIGQEMTLKTLFNLFYAGLFHTYRLSLVDAEVFEELKTFLKNFEVDAFLIKLITMSLDVHYLPIKKLTILYARILSIQFNMRQFYKDSDLFAMATGNLLPEDYLKKFKEKNNPKDVLHNKNPVLQFYAKHNVGECPLAQSIVVGLLRSLLTICNSQSHKKLSFNNSNSGADTYRQWQITYQFLQRYPSFHKNLSSHSQNLLSNYKQFNQTSNSTLPTQYQFYSHKIYTASSITVFFSFLLHSFKQNIFIHFTYLYQLIADANGILVFLKFLTDKFDNFSVPDLYLDASRSLKFENEVMLTVYSVLLMLFGACNNYPEKARNYLFQYNSYLIIKKIPHLFMKNRKNQELPSKEQIEEQFGSVQDPITLKTKELTILCYDLLKIQIPFFSKKVKESSNNMRMIVEIYCELPKTVQPLQRTEFDKILLKNKMKKNVSDKYVRSVQELKTIHHEYNNYYYWANDELTEVKKQQLKEQQKVEMSKTDVEKWLEENVWKYFD